GPVRALQVHDFQLVGAGGNPAVQSRDKSGIDDEVGARSATDGFDRTCTQAERRLGFGTLQDPHGATFYPPISSKLFMAARRSRKGLYIGIAVAVVVVAGAAGLATLQSATPDIAPAKLA